MLPPPLIVGLGELIWDLLPDGKQLGGAPTNFAYISRLLGNDSTIASRIGDDDLGREARTKLERMGIATGHIQFDSLHPTGTVGVRIDERGEASFQVRTDCAWDFLELTEDWKTLASTADAICFGTLGQRNAQARQTILDFLKLTRADAVRVFDVNLRHSFFTPEMLRASLELATIVKLNSQELSAVGRMLGLNNSEEVGHDGSHDKPNAALAQSRETAEKALARELILGFDLKLVAITRAERGSLLVTDEESVTHPGFKVEVKDTIGAGDAFTAALVHHYLRSASLQNMSEAANRMGAWLCTQTGATPQAYTFDL
ncbi:MAG: fructokinase [Acidobacteriota bacterium]|jgi:fructokinase|nr:fructokinase [Acidobacteriota bacterium]